MRCRTQYPFSHSPAIRRWGYAIIAVSFGLGAWVARCGEWTTDQGAYFDNPKELTGVWKKANALQSSGIDVYPLHEMVPFNALRS
jgi:hypothetical protein